MENPNGTKLAVAVLVGFALSTGSCADRPATAPPSATSSSLKSTALAALAKSGAGAASTLEGDIGPGAHYVISVPDGWNGDLVAYAHGYTAPVFPVGIPPGEEPLVEGLRAIALQGGFAFAYSSYSQTGLGLRDAALRTEQLTNLFTSLVERPARTFLVGTSFGGLAALKLVEARPDRYAGLLTLCGMVGGVRAETDYIAHVRVLFDIFYPNVLRGTLYELPADFNLQTDIVEAVPRAIVANPEPALLMAQVAQTPIPFSNGTELVESIVQALVLHAVELEDLLERTHGQGFFDNSSTVYTGNLPPDLLADLNARVPRYSDGAAAAQFLDKNYEPTGDLRVPLVTMHTSMDPVVPILHEHAYRSRVEAKGRGANLHAVTVPKYGHCQFTPQEIVAGFLQMVTLAEPAGSASEVSRIP